MRRFVVDHLPDEQGRCRITGAEARHISKVLRMAPGDRLVLMDSRGLRFLATVASIRPREVVVSVESALPAPPPSPIRITLCQALLKSAPMDYIIQKTSELGVDAIAPFFSERTVVKPAAEGRGNKGRHWKEIALHATKQSDRDQPPKIHPACSLHEILDRYREEEALKVILWEGEQGRDLKGVLKATAPFDVIVGMVGPEGGFSTKETEDAVKAGFIPVSLGKRILRAETAAVALVAVLQYEWGDLGLEKKMPKMS